ncbi:MAG: hypothetical protein JWM31_748 [Solirubrobacterales bacterium]|nr:hypothetical protein [Solirubrobacterales bacterium]
MLPFDRGREARSAPGVKGWFPTPPQGGEGRRRERTAGIRARTATPPKRRRSKRARRTNARAALRGSPDPRMVRAGHARRLVARALHESRRRDRGVVPVPAFRRPIARSVRRTEVAAAVIVVVVKVPRLPRRDQQAAARARHLAGIDLDRPALAKPPMLSAVSALGLRRLVRGALTQARPPPRVPAGRTEPVPRGRGGPAAYLTRQRLHCPSLSAVFDSGGEA